MKRATLPTIIRPIAAPVTVFHHHRYSGFVECLGEKAEIAELATTIKLDAVKSEIDRCLNVTDVMINTIVNLGVATDRRSPRGHILVLVASTVVGIPETKTN